MNRIGQAYYKVKDFLSSPLTNEGLIYGSIAFTALAIGGIYFMSYKLNQSIKEKIEERIGSVIEKGFERASLKRMEEVIKDMKEETDREVRESINRSSLDSVLTEPSMK